VFVDYKYRYVLFHTNSVGYASEAATGQKSRAEGAIRP
jgi:hypothetical protein